MSGASSRRKGNRAELAVVKTLKAWGWHAKTSRATSGMQKGCDIVTDAPVSIEVKDRAALDLSGWLAQAERNATEDAPGVVWHKRRGKANPEEWYVTMSGETLMRLLNG
jgi:hypothetical protein